MMSNCYYYVVMQVLVGNALVSATSPVKLVRPGNSIKTEADRYKKSGELQS